MKPSVAVARQAQAAARTAEKAESIEAKLDRIMQHLGISLNDPAPEPEPEPESTVQSVAPDEQAIASKPAGKKK